MSAPSASDRDGRSGARSKALFERAKALIPGGVNSPVRAFAAVGGDPPFIRSARGAYLVTEDDRTVIDYIGSWGPAILGHAPSAIVEAVCKAAQNGLGFGAATANEVEFAELVARVVPSLRDGMVRLVNSGTEATMSALRLARGFTGRDKIIKMDGGYHGHGDLLLAAAGSGAATLGIPGSAGVPAPVVADTLVVPFNDLDAVARAFAAYPDQIAAVIVEPVAGNMGCIPPAPGYLAGLRAQTLEAGALLVFDEVMTGFRLALGGAQERFDVKPDLTCFAKIAGGGLPLGGYGGRRDIMHCIAPLGPVYQAGTLSGNPLAVAAGLATLRILQDTRHYAALEACSDAIATGLQAAAKRHAIAVVVQRVGSMFTVFFTDEPVTNYDDAKRSRVDQFACFHSVLLEHGVLFPPSQFEAAFVSLAHDDNVIERTLEAADAAFAAVARLGRSNPAVS